MRINLNGRPQDTEAPTLAALIEEQGLDAASVATAVEGDFVPRTARASTPLTEGARVEIVAPRQGG